MSAKTPAAAWMWGFDDGERVFAPSHVHNFYFRIDFDIDGAADNVVEEFNYQPDLENPMMNLPTWHAVCRGISILQ